MSQKSSLTSNPDHQPQHQETVSHAGGSGSSPHEVIYNRLVPKNSGGDILPKLTIAFQQFSTRTGLILRKTRQAGSWYYILLQCCRVVGQAYMGRFTVLNSGGGFERHVLVEERDNSYVISSMTQLLSSLDDSQSQRYIITLRNPTSRFLSHYFYAFSIVSL